MRLSQCCQPPSGRSSISALEQPRHVTLIGKPGFQCRFRDVKARPHPKARSIKLAHRAETRGTCPEGSTELARQRPSIETGNAFELRCRVSDSGVGGNEIFNASE
jgi:hypothetical protein